MFWGDRMQISHTREDDAQVIAISEELGHHEARRIIDYTDTALSMNPEGRVILDLSGLTFMDSSGLAVVLHLQRSLQRAGRTLTVRGTRQQAMRVFRAAGLPKLVYFEGE